MKNDDQPDNTDAEPEAEVDETQQPEETATEDGPNEDATNDEAFKLASEPLSELETAIAERDQFQDQFLRSQAELDNFRKRTHREVQQSRLYQSLPLLRDLLPGLDNLERTITAAENSANVEELLQGVQMVAKHFADVLQRHEVKPILAEGEPFDPNLHEAVQQMPSADHPAMTVLNEVERGYQLHDRVIRLSKVIVSTVPPAPEED